MPPRLQPHPGYMMPTFETIISEETLHKKMSNALEKFAKKHLNSKELGNTSQGVSEGFKMKVECENDGSEEIEVPSKVQYNPSETNKTRKQVLLDVSGAVEIVANSPTLDEPVRECLRKLVSQMQPAADEIKALLSFVGELKTKEICLDGDKPSEDKRVSKSNSSRLDKNRYLSPKKR